MNKEKSNAGFSLVELIVTIMIVAILSGGVVISASLIFNANVKSAAQNLTAMIAKARQQAMSRTDGSVMLKISMDAVSSNYYAYVYYSYTEGGVAKIAELASQKLGNDQLTVSITDSIGTVLYIKNPVDDGATDQVTDVTCHFKQSTGGITENYTDITIDGSETMNIVLIRETGRAFIEY